MSFELITTAREGDVLTITLNRPDRLNACPPDMADEIFAAIRDLDGARAVLITGAGRAFCSGADLAARGERSLGGGEGAFTALGHHYNPMVMALASLPVPVIAAVNGPAAGIGCSIALAADFVVAGSSAYFLQAFVNIGLVPDGGASWMLPRLVGKAQATRMMMLGEKIPAEEAERIGLIYKSVADDALMDEAKALAAKLAGGPTVALGEMKQTIRRGLEGDFATTLQYEAEAQRVAGNSKDAMEGGMAFLQKRKPEFKGA
ncbi:2-(1,2-epoxy-1,2-dihydrophenyl)acetyl-CoA isomerase [Erythrobacter sp. HI0063]|jgi:2-(1,2-epoxy-1,2-dihydrophenyl)acetyl-CoA isomerase|uniref:enoyl-CoA hydratase-related protein n=1 Tax=Erythrobacter sp. HI0063 TaxID=1822240 RepID=UPI0007C2181E|nr:enoyl-CoA hydratase-related protein [Erythrobacter sp. HI0063]KZY57617.1 2-(1,2-epoxy-1,2-dihydrophenyl)acetyl-CoA isomerase [Erythrobacter sp. HI0063]